MSVVRLDAYRKPPEQPCCEYHALKALAERVQQRIEQAASLLVPVSDLEEVLSDLRATSARLFGDLTDQETR